jgi:hypothetical protein
MRGETSRQAFPFRHVSDESMLHRVIGGPGTMIFASTVAAVVTAVAAVLAVIPPFDEYLRSRRSRLGRHRKVRRHHIAVRDRADP